MPTTIRLVLDAAGPNTIVVSPTGCLEVVTTPFPESAWCVPWIHSLFENAAAVASGVEVMLKRQGRDITIKDIRKMVEKALAAEKGIECEFEFLDLRKEIL
jgi:pyruvate/2-oxoacid:ferredoxin oxidoreductase beta subunit